MMTKLTPEQKQLLKDELSVEIAGFLVDDYKYSPEEAIDVLYTSDLQGFKIGRKPTQPGVYIHKGNKVTITKTK